MKNIKPIVAPLMCLVFAACGQNYSGTSPTNPKPQAETSEETPAPTSVPSVTPRTLAFTAAVDRSETQTVTVQNLGDAPLKILGYEIIDPNFVARHSVEGHYQITPSDPFVLACTNNLASE